MFFTNFFVLEAFAADDSIRWESQLNIRAVFGYSYHIVMCHQ